MFQGLNQSERERFGVSLTKLSPRLGSSWEDKMARLRCAGASVPDQLRRRLPVNATSAGDAWLPSLNVCLFANVAGVAPTRTLMFRPGTRPVHTKYSPSTLANAGRKALASGNVTLLASVTPSAESMTFKWPPASVPRQTRNSFPFAKRRPGEVLDVWASLTAGVNVTPSAEDDTMRRWSRPFQARKSLPLPKARAGPWLVVSLSVALPPKALRSVEETTLGGEECRCPSTRRLVDVWTPLQRQGVESEDPSVVGTGVAIGGEGHVHSSPGQQQAGSLDLKVAREDDLAARRPDPGPRNASDLRASPFRRQGRGRGVGGDTLRPPW